MINKNKKSNNIVTINVTIGIKNDNFCLEMRRHFMNHELIKTIVRSAVHNQPLIIQPTFKNLHLSIQALLDKGILYREDEEYFFNI